MIKVVVYQPLAFDRIFSGLYPHGFVYERQQPDEPFGGASRMQ